MMFLVKVVKKVLVLYAIGIDIVLSSVSFKIETFYIEAQMLQVERAKNLTSSKCPNSLDHT